MGFLGDGAVAHGAGGEPLDDAGDGLHFLKRHRGTQTGLELQQPAQGHEVLGLVVNAAGVGLEDVVAAFTRGVLQPEDGLRVEQVRFAVAAPLVFAAAEQGLVRQFDAVLGVGHPVPGQDFGGDDVEADAAELGVRAGEVLVHEVLAEAEGFEGLGTRVGGHGGDAHLGHDLQDALAEALDQVVDAVLRGDPHDVAGGDELFHGFHGQVRVHGGGAVADEHGDVVRLADVAGLHHEGGLGAVGAAQQVVVHGADEQQGRDRRPLGVRVAVREHDVLDAAVDGAGDLLADFGEPGAEGVLAAFGAVESADLHGDLVAVGALDVRDLGELVVVDHGERQRDLRLADLLGVQQVAVRADRARQGRDELFADGVQRRVGDLREGLHEVVEEQPRALGQHGHRGVRAHGTERLGAGAGHRAEQDLQFLGGVAEGALADVDRGGGVHHVLALGQVLEVDQVVLDPFGPGVRCGDLGLDLGVVDDPAGLGVHQEHLARRDAALLDHLGGFDVDHADLGGEDDQAVLGDPVPARAQAVAVQRGADQVAVGEGDGGGAVPRLHEHASGTRRRRGGPDPWWRGFPTPPGSSS